jgi:hypothetical protein
LLPRKSSFDLKSSRTAKVLVPSKALSADQFIAPPKTYYEDAAQLKHGAGENMESEDGRWLCDNHPSICALFIHAVVIANSTNSNNENPLPITTSVAAKHPGRPAIVISLGIGPSLPEHRASC